MSDDTSGWTSPETPIPSDGPYVISPTTEVLTSHASPTHWGRRIAVGGAGLAVLVLAGGGYFAYGALSGGGTQPDKFVPSNAAAYFAIDLDPPAGQKIAGVQLLHKLPKGAVKSTSDDYRELLLSSVFQDNDQVNYEADVKPWLGDRVAVAVLPGTSGGDPIVEGVAQVKDEAAFKAAVPKLFKTPDDGGYVLRDGFVIISKDSALAKTAADDAVKSNIRDNADYVADTKDLGDRVATGWYDASRVAALLPAEMRTAQIATSLKGRGTFAVQLSAHAVELVGKQVGGAANEGKPGTLMSHLPDNTVAAVELTGVGVRVVQQWSDSLASLKKVGVDVETVVQGIEDQYKVKLPADLGTLLGSDTLGAVTSTKGDDPGFGYYAITDTTKAQELIDRLGPALSTFGIDAPEVTGNGIAWGSSPDWAKDVQSGHLGDDAKFKDALPDISTAQSAIYVDLQGIAALDYAKTRAGSATSQVEQSHAQAFGLTSSVDGTTTEIKVRLTVD